MYHCLIYLKLTFLFCYFSLDNQLSTVYNLHRMDLPGIPLHQTPRRHHSNKPHPDPFFVVAMAERKRIDNSLMIISNRYRFAIIII